MQYVERFNQMRELLDLSAEMIRIPGSPACIRTFGFRSSFACPPGWKREEEFAVPGNYNFRYPVIFPDQSPSYAHAIVMMHGLNERNWNKHLPGALHLAMATNRPVILFPLSFHINRGLPEWSDARKMAAPLALRKLKFGDIKEASVANYALSDRLTLEPERFVTSGYQSATDLLNLLKMIHAGKHPFLMKEAGTSVFAYSISCMVMQVLMISNPSGILDHTRIVLLAGGCLFPDLHGISRFIMDSQAFATLQGYYSELFTAQRPPKTNWFEDCAFGKAFSMLVSPKYENERKKLLGKFIDNLMVAAMKNDQVIPLQGIHKAFGNNLARSRHCMELHFPYPYTHENPFPVLYTHLNDAVDSGFLSLYESAAEFLLTGRPMVLPDRKADNKTTALIW
jgi:hypothetical protein